MRADLVRRDDPCSESHSHSAFGGAMLHHLRRKVSELQDHMDTLKIGAANNFADMAWGGSRHGELACAETHGARTLCNTVRSPRP